MRMWMVDPKIMCRKHLMGEHVELHMLVGTLERKKSIRGFVVNGLLEPLSIKRRHQDLVEEILARGYNHKSPLVVPSFEYLTAEEMNARVDREKSLADLLARCGECGVGHTAI